MVEFGITYFISTLLTVKSKVVRYCHLYGRICSARSVDTTLCPVLLNRKHHQATERDSEVWDGEGSVNFPVVVRSRFSSVHWDNVPISENWPHFSFSLDFTSNGFMKGKTNPCLPLIINNDSLISKRKICCSPHKFKSSAPALVRPWTEPTGLPDRWSMFSFMKKRTKKEKEYVTADGDRGYAGIFLAH